MNEADAAGNALPLVGATVGRYVLERRLGEGGMGVVYAARHQDLGRPAAVKILHERHDSAQARQRFLREGQLASRIRHSNIVDVYDVGTEASLDYLVMELLQGEALDRLMARERPLAPQRIADLLVPVVSALAAAHEAGIVHRDLKPGNIFLSNQRNTITPKVLDFGISKLDNLEVTAGLTSTGMLLGTPYYMSPEQAQTDKNVDARSDQYSMGVILYEAVTGRVPIQERALYQLLPRIVQGDFPPPRQLNPHLASAFEQLILCAMAREPGRRFPSTRAFGQALLAFAGERVRNNYAEEFVESAAADASTVPPSARSAPPSTTSASGTRSLRPPVNSTPRRVVIGREREIQYLGQALEDAALGHLRTVVVAGEPGIGKTALLESFVSSVRAPGAPADEGAPLLAYGHCIEHFGAGIPYMPIVELLAQVARGPGGPALEVALRQCAPSWLLQLPTLLRPGEREVIQATAAQPSRYMSHELADALAMLTSLDAGGAGRMLVIVLEDVHWADASTIEFLAVLTRRRVPCRLLVVCTQRPFELVSGSQPLRDLLDEVRLHDPSADLSLSPLSCSDIDEYLDRQFSPHHFPPGLAAALREWTAGNPLFLANVLFDLEQRGVLARSAEGWGFSGTLDLVHSATPRNIRELMRRQSEGLRAEEQDLLMAASLDGPTFGVAIVAATLDTDVQAVERRCNRLVELDHFLERAPDKSWPDGSRASAYAFRHAIYRAWWAERAAPEQRVEWQRRIAQRKVTAYGTRARSVAAELALHFEEGREYAHAMQWRIQAGQLALERGAPSEAAGQLQRALSLFGHLPPSDASMSQELELQISVGSLSAMTEGYTTAATENAFQRAQELCARLGDARQRFPVLVGLARVAWGRGQLIRASEIVAELLESARASGDSIAAIAAHTSAAQVSWFCGDPRASLEHSEEVLRLHRTHWNASLLAVFGYDPSVLCGMSAGVSLQMLAQSDAARRAIGALEGLEVVRHHPYLKATALIAAAYLHFLQDEASDLRRVAGELLLVSSKVWVIELAAVARVFEGWVRAQQGDRESGIEQIRLGAAELQARGADLASPMTFSLLALACSEAGLHAGAAAALQEATSSAQRIGPYWYDAELERIRGVLLLQRASSSAAGSSGAGPAREQAAAHFNEALKIARRQGAVWWEMRATRSLEELTRDPTSDSATCLPMASSS